MSVVALCSAHGAPGVTSTGLALTWMWPIVHPARRVLLLDADPAGSGLLTGYLQPGVGEACGVLALAGHRPPFTPEQLIQCAVAIDADSTRMILPGMADPAQARPLAPMWAAVAETARELGGLGIDMIVDLGRLGHRFEAAALLEGADVVAVAARGEVASLVPSAAAVRRLRTDRPGRLDPVAVVIGQRYSPGEIATALGVTHVMPVASDAWAASRFESGGASGWRFERSPLLRTARAAVEQLARLAPSLSPAVTS